MRTRATGIALALAAALVSGVSIYVNGRAVRHFADATVYTTAKNLVAGVLLVALAVVAGSPGATAPRAERPTRGQWLALFSIGVVGGSVPFVLFFEGLARAEATQAAFIQKTLVIWVALLAVPLLHERFGWPHLLAVCLLVAGQAWLVGHSGTIAFGAGEAMILAATLLWAVEVVWVKKLVGPLSPRLLAAARMGIGTALLLAWVAVSGRMGALTGLDGAQWRWIVLTGLLLTAYVAIWYAALARAQAVDVTAVLVFGAVITALLTELVDGAAVSALGIGLVTLGTAIVAVVALRPPAAEPATS
jgi:drug/metabolite transporter (DMT)-like permease